MYGLGQLGEASLLLLRRTLLLELCYSLLVNGQHRVFSLFAYMRHLVEEAYKFLSGLLLLHLLLLSLGCCHGHSLFLTLLVCVVSGLWTECRLQRVPLLS